MDKKPFQAESKRLLDLMINSIYTHKEIFLRELISNASDALDKYYVYSLENKKTPEPLEIDITLNKPNRLLTITDNGIGMTEQEMEENLGTIAKSGTLMFREELEKKNIDEDVESIGQFGVGFYSAFMVADEVRVLSKSVASDQAFEWVSNGTDGYSIEPARLNDHGTKVILHLKADDEMEQYAQYLDSSTIEGLVKKYSDFIRYPIRMNVSVFSETGEEEGTEKKVLNTMIPIWKRPRNEISQKDFDEFFKSRFGDYMDPLETIFFNVEGKSSFTALLYIPARVPSNFNTREYPYGLQLYSKGVYIESNCEELLPNYLRFIKGLVDSQDLSLNISREMLQHDYQLRIIKKRIERKVLDALSSMLKNQREKYISFWKNFGLEMKIGAYEEFGKRKDKLENLLLFESSTKEGLITLKEYVSLMKEDQKVIYFASGNNIQTIDKLPAVRKLKDQDIPVLYLTSDVDEFVLEVLHEYDGHHFQNALQGEFESSTQEEKELIDTQTKENRDLLNFIKKSLPEVANVVLSTRMEDEPVLLVAGDGISFEMERVFRKMNAMDNLSDLPVFNKAQRILEINPTHEIWQVLKDEFKTNQELVKTLSEILYDQALLIEGFTLKDPVEYTRKVMSVLSSLRGVSNPEQKEN